MDSVLGLADCEADTDCVALLLGVLEGVTDWLGDTLGLREGLEVGVWLGSQVTVCDCVVEGDEVPLEVREAVLVRDRVRVDVCVGVLERVADWLDVRAWEDVCDGVVACVTLCVGVRD